MGFRGMMFRLDLFFGGGMGWDLNDMKAKCVPKVAVFFFGGGKLVFGKNGFFFGSRMVKVQKK